MVMLIDYLNVSALFIQFLLFACRTSRIYFLIRMKMYHSVINVFTFV